MILRQRWRSQGTTYVLCLFTVHWPITNASTPLTVTFYWWQRSPSELRRRKFYSLCKFLLLRDLYDRYYWKVIGDIGAYFDRHLQLSLKSVYFPTAWCLCKCARLVSHCEIDVELSPPFVYPANRPCDFALRHRQGCRLLQKVIKNPADVSKMSNLVYYQLNFSNLCYCKKKKKWKPAIHWEKVRFCINSRLQNWTNE